MSLIWAGSIFAVVSLSQLVWLSYSKFVRCLSGVQEKCKENQSHVNRDWQNP